MGQISQSVCPWQAFLSLSNATLLLIDLDHENWILYVEGVEPLLQKESGMASFGAKVAPSLNGLDLSL
jgi:hypothetical protein